LKLNRCSKCTAICSVVVLFLFRASLYCQMTQSKVKEQLTGRVTAFYTAMQRNQTILASGYLIPKARPDFRNQQHGKFNSFKIVNIDFEKGGKSAIVEVRFNVLIPSIVRPVDIPNATRWKLIAGVWLIDPTDPPPSQADIFQKYYYDRIQKNLPSELKFDQYKVDLGRVEQGSTPVVKFSYTNLSSKEIRIEKIFLQSEFMKDLTTQKVIKPQEKAEIQVQMDTSKIYGEVETSIFVQFEPIQEMARLSMATKVYRPKDSSITKKTSAKKAADSPSTPAPSGTVAAPAVPLEEKKTDEPPAKAETKPDAKK
jgi:hypothetical protein